VFFDITFVFSTNFHISRYTTFNGLSQNDISCIYQDSQGFIWIGTNDGLCRYDGYDFKTYYKGDNGLESTIIHSITEDKNKNLWVSTPYNGLYKYDRLHDIFVNIDRYVTNKTFKNIPRNIISHFIDSHNSIWLTLEPSQSVLVKIDFDNNFSEIKNITFFEESVNGLAYSSVNEFIEDKLGNLFLATSKGLIRYNYRTNTFKSIDNERCNSIQLLSHDKLIAAYESEIAVIDAKTLSKTTLNPDFGAQKIIFQDNILWMVNSDGTHIAKYGSQPSRLYDYECVERFSNELPKTITNDWNNNIWVGFYTTGIRQYRINIKDFNHFGKSNSIGNNFISSIFFDKNNKMWIGTLGSGLFSVQTPNGHVNSNSFNATNLLKNKIINSIVQSPLNNDLYVGLQYNPSIYKINSVTGQTEELKTNIYNVKSMLFDSLYLWIGSYYNGLWRYEVANQQFKKILINNTEIVRSLLKDKNGNIWVGTDIGLFVIERNNLKDDTVKVNPVYYNQNGRLIRFENYVLPIFEASNGTIWIGTLGDGLIGLSNIGNDFKCDSKVYSTKNGLSNNSIKCIIEDSNNSLWISTNKGLNKIDVHTDWIQNYDVTDGLQDLQFCELSGCYAPNKMIYLGGVNGFNGFFSEQIKNDSIPPKLVLTDFLLFNESVKIGEKYNGRIILENSITETKSIKLKYNQNSFSIVFLGLHFVSPKKIKFRYILDGYDKTWINTTAKDRVAKYTNLPPGKYTFRLEGSNADGVLTKQQLSLNIVIDAPWWQKWYMYLLYFLIIFLTTLLIVRLLIKRQQERNEIIIANAEKKLTKELMNMKVKFFTNISHEFRTPLTLILSPIKIFLADTSIPEHVKNHPALHTIIQNANVLLRLINQLLTFSKNEQEKLNVKFTYDNISHYLLQLFNQFHFMAVNKDIKLQYKTTNEELKLWFDSNIMEQIVYNLVSNAIKYTPDNGEVTLDINDSDTEFIYISVIDNGVGVPDELKGKIFERFFSNAGNIDGIGIGLSLTKDLVELIGGRITFQTEKNKGSVFSIQISRKYTEKQFLVENLEQNSSNIIQKRDYDEPKSAEEKQSDENTKSSLLIVDDNVQILKVITDLFSSNFNVFTAENGQAAFSLVLEKMPDIVISDVMMPIMDGLQLCQTLKKDERTSHIPVILLTAKTSIENQTEGFLVKADGYCSKPFDNDLLVEMVHSTLENRRIIARKFQKEIALNPSTLSMTRGDEVFLQKLIDIVEENILESNLSVEMLCNRVGMMPNTLNKKLKALTNCTAVHFIQNIKLKRAAQLLSLKHYTVMEVMYEVGFNDLKHFRRCFKSEFGITPSEYKKNRCIS
jgi:signal transduction histidine kinase/ligand-binding sensor domain-containing protein/AraC-like DNA-binding protein